jgi:hypothetical protein
MSYVEQKHSLFVGQTLSTFHAQDGSQVTLTRDHLTYTDAAEDKRAGHIVAKQNAFEAQPVFSRIVAGRGNNTSHYEETAPLNGVRAAYDAETGVIRFSSPYLDWELDAGVSEADQHRASAFVDQVNSQSHQPKYVPKDYDAILSRASSNDAQ